jgi:hypothetical protein
MEGVAERDRGAIERDVALAWRIENFARTKALENLSVYLEQMRPASPEEKRDRILAFFRGRQAQGAPVKITLVKPDNDAAAELS